MTALLRDCTIKSCQSYLYSTTPKALLVLRIMFTCLTGSWRWSREKARMSQISKVLVIGSGPIIIGQAAEFDYAGTQACKSLREEGITTVLVNSNPATIMTDEGIADIVYIDNVGNALIGHNSCRI